MERTPVQMKDDIHEAVKTFWDTVPPVWNQVRAYIRQIAVENYGISVEQFHILRHVHNGINSISELAVAKHISRPAISQSVDVLVQDGLLTRRQATEDRRFVQLELTEEGELLLNDLFDQTNRWIMLKFSILPQEELVQLKDGLLILKKMIEVEP